MRCVIVLWNIVKFILIGVMINMVNIDILEFVIWNYDVVLVFN